MSATNTTGATHLTPNTSAVIEIPFLEIRQSPLNPRKHFDPEALEDLAASIRLFGIEQAITVRPMTLCGSEAYEHPECRYEIVMGERRYRAALMAELPTIPARVVECTDDELIARALTENVERQDLSCIEIAHGYRALVGQGWKQDQIAQKFHTDQPSVSLVLGLLRLPEYVQGLLAAQRLTKSHGIALLPLAEEEKAVNWLAKRVIDESLSEKELRELVRQKKSELEQANQPALFPPDTSKPSNGASRPQESAGTKPTSTPDTKPATPDVKPDFTPADAKREFEESQKPDPDVIPLSERPSVPAQLPASAPVMHVVVSGLGATALLALAESENYKGHDLTDIVGAILVRRAVELELIANPAKATETEAKAVETTPEPEAEMAIEYANVGYCYPQDEVWKGGGDCENGDGEPAYFDFLGEAREFARQQSIINARFLIQVTLKTVKGGIRGDLWYFRGQQVPGGISNCVPSAKLLAEVGCVLEELCKEASAC